MHKTGASMTDRMNYAPLAYSIITCCKTEINPYVALIIDLLTWVLTQITLLVMQIKGRRKSLALQIGRARPVILCFEIMGRL